MGCANRSLLIWNALARVSPWPMITPSVRIRKVRFPCTSPLRLNPCVAKSRNDASQNQNDPRANGTSGPSISGAKANAAPILKLGRSIPLKYPVKCNCQAAANLSCVARTAASLNNTRPLRSSTVARNVNSWRVTFDSRTRIRLKFLTEAASSTGSGPGSTEPTGRTSSGCSRTTDKNGNPRWKIRVR